MDGIENALLVGAGGLGMWIVQVLAGRFMDKKYTLEKERFDKLVNTVERLDITLQRIDAENIRMDERLNHVAAEIADIKENYRSLRDKIVECELKIAKEHD
jgi:predicted nuclease with TOPRIM domain